MAPVVGNSYRKVVMGVRNRKRSGRFGPIPLLFHVHITTCHSATMAHSTHDEINLVRLIRRLEKSTLDPSWSNNGDDVWLKTLGTLQVCSPCRAPSTGANSGIQTVKYARKLLKNVELNDYDPALYVG